MADRKITALYIEDNAENEKLMRHIFDGLFEGTELLCCRTAEEGLEIIYQTRPDLILMDIDLPGMDGFAALKQIQQNHVDNVPVLAVTASAKPFQIERGLKAGFNEYIIKPLNVHHLRKIIDRYLESIRATAD